MIPQVTTSWSISKHYFSYSQALLNVTSTMLSKVFHATERAALKNQRQQLSNLSSELWLGGKTSGFCPCDHSSLTWQEAAGASFLTPIKQRLWLLKHWFKRNNRYNIDVHFHSQPHSLQVRLASPVHGLKSLHTQIIAWDSSRVVQVNQEEFKKTSTFH